MGEKTMERTPDSTRPNGRLWGILAVLAMAASLVFLAPAAATHEDSVIPQGVEFVRTKADGTEVFKMPSLFVYDNTTGDQLEYLTIHGGDMLDICEVRPGDEDGLPGKAKTLVRELSNGTFLVKGTPAGYTSYVSVYKTDMNVPDFFGSVCGGFFEAGAPIPPPFATGTATFRHKSWVKDPMDVLDYATWQPAGRYRNGVEGTVVDVDGILYDLKTVGVFKIRDPQGPPDFTTMTSTLTPQAG